MRINLLISTTICALLIIVWPCRNFVSFAQEQVTTVTLSTTTLGVGDSGIVDAEINCATDRCGAFAITIRFDPIVLRVDSAEVGPYMGTQFFVVENVVDNDAGLVRLAAATLGTPPKTEDRDLFYLHVTGLQAGATVIFITELQVGDQTGRPLDTVWVSSIVTVSEEVPGPPTATSPTPPLPTDTPAPTVTQPSLAATTASTTPPGSGPVTHNADWTPVVETFEGIEMVFVPAGCFMMGSEHGSTDENPVHQQCFDQPFWLDRYEVTNGQFAEFSGEAELASNWSDGDRPRENISWFEARDYCQRRGGRLPTEREWEYAARGPDGLIYPWGDDFAADKVVYGGNSNDRTAVVGSLPDASSWVGALDMAGNVGEWVSTVYGTYPYDGADGRENLDEMSGWRVLRGGNWYDTDSFMLRAAFRLAFSPDFRDMRVGFRCARAD